LKRDESPPITGIAMVDFNTHISKILQPCFFSDCGVFHPSGILDSIKDLTVISVFGYGLPLQYKVFSVVLMFSGQSVFIIHNPVAACSYPSAAIGNKCNAITAVGT
jgi:hypothetical protein